MNFKKRVNGSWTDTPHYIHNTSTDTLTTLPAVIHLTGTTATVGLKGNTIQNGTPSPDNPIMPQSTGERTGNLFDKTADYTVGATTYNYTISGLDPNKYYTCSTNFERISGVDTASIYFNGGNSGNNGVWRNTPRTVKPDSNGEIIVYIRYSANAGALPIIDDVMAGTIWVMVNEGSTPIPYGYKIPISSGGENLINIYANDKSNGYVNNAMLRDSGYIYTPSYGFISEYQPIDESVTYTLNTGGKTGDAQSICFYTSDKQFISGITYANRTIITFTTPQGAKYFRCTVMRTQGDTESYKYIMLNRGATALPYKPYIEPTETNIYLGEVQTTRRIRKYEFTGQENWNRTSNGAYYLPSTSNPIGNYKFISADISINSHFPSQGVTVASLYVNDGKSAFFYGQSSNTREYYIAARDIPTLENFKSYLAQQYAAGTPVTVWYVLATPETAVVNEPLRKIGDYADTVSGISIPTITGKDTFDVETTLKPSEVSLSYTGWHDAGVKEWDGSQWNE